jgi:3-isopropylmalate dehydratase small subunit
MDMVVKGNAITVAGEHLNADTAMGWYLGMDTLPAEEVTSKFMSGVNPEIAGTVQKGDILFCGRDFGFGKVHTAIFTAMRALDIKCIVADSFATQMVQSAMSTGTYLVQCPGVLEHVSMGDAVEVDVENAVVKNRTTGREIKGTPFPEYMLNAMKSRGLMGVLVRKAMALRGSQQQG